MHVRMQEHSTDHEVAVTYHARTPALGVTKLICIENLEITDHRILRHHHGIELVARKEDYYGVFDCSEHALVNAVEIMSAPVYPQ